jgi:hypothetical protein
MASVRGMLTAKTLNYTKQAGKDEKYVNLIGNYVRNRSWNVPTFV